MPAEFDGPETKEIQSLSNSEAVSVFRQMQGKGSVDGVPRTSTPRDAAVQADLSASATRSQGAMDRLRAEAMSKLEAQGVSAEEDKPSLKRRPGLKPRVPRPKQPTKPPPLPPTEPGFFQDLFKKVDPGRRATRAATGLAARAVGPLGGGLTRVGAAVVAGGPVVIAAAALLAVEELVRFEIKKELAAIRKQRNVQVTARGIIDANSIREREGLLSARGVETLVTEFTSEITGITKVFEFGILEGGIALKLKIAKAERAALEQIPIVGQRLSRLQKQVSEWGARKALAIIGSPIGVTRMQRESDLAVMRENSEAGISNLSSVQAVDSMRNRFTKAGASGAVPGWKIDSEDEG